MIKKKEKKGRGHAIVLKKFYSNEKVAPAILFKKSVM
jgi:hypothetical protein